MRRPESFVVRITPEQQRPLLEWGELWRFRDVVVTLAVREIKLRYKQTLLGTAWALIQPLAASGVLAMVFGALVGGEAMGAGATPYFIFLLCGMVPWQFFASGLQYGGSSLVNNQQLVTKVYLPRMVLPLSAMAFTTVDFAVGLAVIASLCLAMDVALGLTVLLWPLCGLLVALCTFASALWISSLSAVFRDFGHAVPFLIRLLMFLSPVVFSTETLVVKLPSWAAFLFSLNPIAGIIELFRWSVIGGTFPGHMLSVSIITTLILLFGGLYCFRAMERVFADLV